MKKKFKNQKGITLVALVVTIIILIILAGVSINAIIGENGVITLAKKAKENAELAQIEEQQSLNQLFDDFELQESQIEGTGSYAAELKLNEFKNKIADYIDEAANGSIDTTNEYIKPDYTTASTETFGNAIKQIVAKVTSDATATAEDIAQGKTAWVNGNKITGSFTSGSTIIKSMYNTTGMLFPILNGQSNSISVEHVFENSGTYNIYITEIETGNCFDTTTLSISGVTTKNLYNSSLNDCGGGTTLSRSRVTLVEATVNANDKIVITSEGTISGAQSYGTGNEMALYCLIMK